jgi:hypothetical protein
MDQKNQSNDNELKTIQILSEIIANQIIKKLLQDEQLGITASGDDSQICEKSKTGTNDVDASNPYSMRGLSKSQVIGFLPGFHLKLIEAY